MKFASVSALVLLVLPFLTTANVLPRTTTPTIPASQCNPDNLQCCLNAQESDNITPPLRALLELLGINISGLTGVVGVTCSPLHILISGYSDCTAQPLCCTNNNFAGIVALGCVPVNISL